MPGDDPVETQQTLAFHRVLQHASITRESAEKEEVEVGDLLVALFQEPDAHSMTLLRAQGVSRLDLLRYISHGESKLGDDSLEGEGGAAPMMGGDESEGVPADPLGAFATNLTERAAKGELDPLIGRGPELDRAIHILARRRKNNPIFVGETGVGKTALAEGLALRIHEGRVPEDLEAREIFSSTSGRCSPGRATAATSKRASRRSRCASRARSFILFIDEIHTILGAGSAQGTTVDASNLLKPGSPMARCAAWARRPIRSTGTSSATARSRGASRRSMSRADAGRMRSDPEGARAALRRSPRRALHGPALKACVDLAVRH